MARSPDELTRRTRDAANAAAAAVIAFACLFAMTTQIGAVREVSPFADDPYDIVASFAVIFLPLVADATWVRSLAHREMRLSVRTARRIVMGSTLAVTIVAASVAVDLVSMLRIPGWTETARSLTWVIVALVGITAAVTLVAAAMVKRAIGVVRSPASANLDTAVEPDVIDDALDLAVEVVELARLSRLRRPLLAAARFFERSPISPRRHRVVFGLVLALSAAVAFVTWHAFREGPWASPAAALLFGVLPAVGILAMYLATLAPLRLLRPTADSQSRSRR